MSMAFLMIFGGFCLVIAGWKNVSFTEALRGNFDVPKSFGVHSASAPVTPGGGK